MRSICLLILATGCASSKLVDRADQLARDQQWVSAVSAYEDALQQRPTDTHLKGRLTNARRAAGAHFYLEGKKAEKMRDLNAALGHYEQAVALFPDHDAAWTDGSRVRRERRVLARAVADAQGLTDEGLCIEARAAWEKIYADRPTFEAIEAGRLRALEICFDKAIAAVDVGLTLGDVDMASEFIAEAKTYFPTHPKLTAAELRVGGEGGRKARLAAGHQAFLDGDYGVARTAYAAVAAQAPGADVAAALQAATALGLERALARCQQARKAGDWLAELETLEQALALQPPDPALRSALERRARALRKQAAASLYRKGERAERSGLFGASWVWFRLAGLVGRSFMDADGKASVALGKLRQAASYRILIPPVVHTTPHAGLGAQLQKGLFASLSKAVAGSQVTLTMDADAEPPPDAILRSRLSHYEVVDSPWQRVVEAVPFKVPDHKQTNEAFVEAFAAHIEAHRVGDATAVTQTLAQLGTVPITVSESAPASEVSVPWLKGMRSAEVRGEAELYDRANDKIVTAAYADATKEAAAQARPSVPALGWQEQSPTLQTHAAIRGELADAILSEWSDQLGPVLRLAGTRFLRLARHVDGEARLHFIALALFAGTSEAPALTQELRERTGYIYGEDRYDPRHLLR